MKLTRAMFDVLEAAEHIIKVYGPGSGMMTGRILQRRDAERCRAEGLLETKLIAVMDGDFAKEPWTERWGYVLTNLGEAALNEAREKNRSQGEEPMRELTKNEWCDRWADAAMDRDRYHKVLIDERYERRQLEARLAQAEARLTALAAGIEEAKRLNKEDWERLDQLAGILG
jgi:hypothetical protein